MARGNFGERTPAQMAAAAAMARSNTQRAKRRKREHLEDAIWMASTGETTEGAAERFGISTDALWKRLEGAGRTDVWEKMRDNERERFGETLGERKQRERLYAKKGTVIGPRKAA